MLKEMEQTRSSGGATTTHGQPRRESPLVRFALAARSQRTQQAGGVTVSELPFLAHINLRGEPSDPAFLQAAESVLGTALPLEANTVAQGSNSSVFWFGPNEWLIVAPGDQEQTIAKGLRAALEGQFAAVTEVTGGQTVLVLWGPDARTLLEKGCPLDLHPREFKPGQCAQTRLAKSPILLYGLEDGRYLVVVRRSFSDYLWLWLEDAAREFGLVVAPTSAVAGLGG